jgi:hypothetical protein
MSVEYELKYNLSFSLSYLLTYIYLLLPSSHKTPKTKKLTHKLNV